jgi:hypothetical protein
MVYTFTLRSDATWTDSSPVTAYDVEYGVLRSLDPETGSSSAWILWDIENAKDYNLGSITDPDLVGVEALDATHIRFTLEGPAVYFPGIAGLPPARPQPQWAIDAYGEDWTDPDNIVSNGPYRLVAWLRNAPWMRVNYGDHWEPNAVGLNYPAGHTVWLTVTNEFDTVKATATMLTEVDGGWPPDDGFLWTEAADWAPSQPDIRPEDWVYARSDEGYTHTLRVGAISAVVDFSDNSVSGYVRAPWFSETLPVVCSPGTMWPGEWSDSTVEPDGSVPYYCQWDPAVWDIEPGDTFDVRYEEPDGDWVFNTFRAAWYTYLPLVLREYTP